jgi:NTE family protein
MLTIDPPRVAHLGVLKALEQNGIPIDLVAGCSMGVIVGYAAGLRAAEMINVARQIGTRRMLLSALDVSLTGPGLLAGNRLIKIFGPLVGPIQTFEQLQLPCRTVATDIETGERVVIGSGRLDAAFRASCSVPMILCPVRHGGRVLVDGGIVDPVPAETMQTLQYELGNFKAIAADVRINMDLADFS